MTAVTFLIPKAGGEVCKASYQRDRKPGGQILERSGVLKSATGVTIGMD